MSLDILFCDPHGALCDPFGVGFDNFTNFCLLMT